MPDGGSYVVAKEVRDLCIFSPHSVIRDPPFSRIDLVSCRNLLIYFGPDVQEQVIPVFHYALRPEGYLFLGTAENIGQFADLFAAVEKKQRIFRRRADGAHGLRLPLLVAGMRLARPPGRSAGRPPLGGFALRQAVEGQVLERFAPPFVVVNRDGDIAYFSARTGKYLEAAAGAPTRQILTIARKGLRLDLRTALREAVEGGTTVVREGHRGRGRGRPRADGHADGSSRCARARARSRCSSCCSPTRGRRCRARRRWAGSGAQDGAALQLERELRDTRERLQSLIEEYETALEELKSSNEELVSVNEELQSTNEELEASKEELQSVNEELHTVNAELNGKVEALDHANADLQNLFDSTDVATVFLDADLVIRSFTPAVANVFAILPGDRGRPITDLASRIDLPDLAADVAAVLAGGDPIERRVGDQLGGAHYLVRISPYRAADRRTRGVVVTFVDVTSVTRAEHQQKVLIAELHHRTRNLLTVVQAIATLTLGRGGTIKSFSERLAALGRAQALLSQTGEDVLDLGEVVRLELSAHPAADGRVTIAGPPIPLGPKHVQALALAIAGRVDTIQHGAACPAPGSGDRQPADDQPGQPSGITARAVRARQWTDRGRACADYRLDHGHQPSRAWRGNRGRWDRARATAVSQRPRWSLVEPADPVGHRAAVAGVV